MPGFANWKVLYRVEYEALHEEGYDVRGFRTPGDENYVAVEGAEPMSADADMEAWKAAYEELVGVRDKGLREGYPYVEPNDLESIFSQAGDVPELEMIDEATYRKRVEGAWRGRCAGVIQGKPVEMWLKPEIKEFLQSVDAWPLEDFVPWRSEKLGKTTKNKYCAPDIIDKVEIDDDTSYTVAALRLVEQEGKDFGKGAVAWNWLKCLPYNCLYSATKMSYYHLVNREPGEDWDALVDALPWKCNPMREGLNGAIRADFYGYLHPGDPRAAAKMEYNDAAVNMSKNGIYAALFVVGCIAAAMSKHPSVETILRGGLSVVPKESRLYEAVEWTWEEYEKAGEWEPVCDKIYERYGHLNWAGVMYNYPIVALCLLHGDMDFTRTIGTATMCGVDTDCNAGTAGSIIGAAVGVDGIDRRFIDPFNDRIMTFVANNGGGDGTITDLVERTVALGRE